METFELVAESRTDTGKGASRRLRREGKIPGIVYGSTEAPEMITLDHDHVLHHLEEEAFYSHILDLTIDGKSQKVVLKDLQRHNYKPLLTHLDLLRVNANEKLTMRVPLHFINEDKCMGVKMEGGIISHIITELDIVCLPKDLPEYIEVDLENVNLGESIHLSDLKLPEGVESYALAHGGDASQSIASVHAPKGSAGDEEEADGGEEAAGDDAPEAAE